MNSVLKFVKYLGNKTVLVSTYGALTLVTSTVHAQSTSSILIEEIVVTATKKKNVENVHDVPSAITAFGNAQLEALKVRDLTSLNFAIPNTILEDIGTTKGSASFAIRGLGINSSIPSIEPTVGVFIDGIYYGINSGIVFDTFDLQSIEVLRGPQGVLFGRNVTGGAIVINTTDPSFESSTKFKVAAESGFRGTGANYYVQGSTTGTLIKDKVAGKLAVYYNDDNGWFENTLADGSKTDFGANDTFIIRPALTWTPNDTISITAKYEYGEFSGDGPAAQSHINGSGVEGQIRNFDRDSFDFSINEGTFNESSWHNFSLKTDIDVAFGDGQITNILGYRQFNNEALSDIDASPLNIFNGEVITDQEQTSNELRYNGQFGNWNITTGLFYFQQDIAYSERRILLEDFLANFNLPPSISTGGGILDQETFGVFTQVEYQINEKLTLTAGLRYSDEEKEVSLASIVPGLQTANPDCLVTDNNCAFDFSNETNPGEATFRTDNLSPKLGLQYAVNDSLNLYGQWNRSFRAGGFNLRNTSLDSDNLGSFDDEEVDSLEFGFKYRSSNGSSLNAAVFVTRIDDLQREVNTTDPVVGIVQVVRNTANAEILGFEIDGKLAVNENLVLTASLGLLDGKYKDLFFDLTGDGIINRDDFNLSIPRVVDSSYSVGAIYSHSLGKLGEVTAQINYGRRDDLAYTEDNLGFLDDTRRLDGNVTLLRNSGVAVSLYGKNLTNQVLHASDAQLPDTLGGVPLGGTFAPLTKGRVIGIEVQHEF